MIRRYCNLPPSAGVSGLRPGALAVMMALLIAAPESTTAGTHMVQRVRNATAEVVRDGDDWVVAVEFVASHSLGTAKDLEINRQLAREYASRGLFRELKGTPKEEIVVSGFQIESSGEEEGLWKARFRTPAEGISMVAKTRPEPVTAEVPESVRNGDTESDPAGADASGEIVSAAPSGANDSGGVSTPRETDSDVASDTPGPRDQPTPRTSFIEAHGLPVPTVPAAKMPSLPIPEVPVPDVKASVLPVPALPVPNISNPAP